MSNENKKELVPTNDNAFKLQTTMAENLKEEMDGFDLTFDRIKVPSGGGLVYELPSENPDEPTMAKDFRAVMLYHRPERSYYKTEFDGKNETPDCASYDGKLGVEKESGEVCECRECPLNEFGSGKNDSKACKTKRKVFLLIENTPLPVIFNIPTSSVKDFGNYIAKTVTKYGSTAKVVTKFSLKRDTNQGGIVYSKVVASFDRTLTDDELKSVFPMTEQVKALAKNMKTVERAEE